MLYLLFRLGNERYALPATMVAEIIPLIAITPLPGTPAGVAGIINYHGGSVPVIDLTTLAFDRPAVSRISTRIVIVHYAAGRHRLGLVAEHVTDTLNCVPEEFQPTGVENRGSPYLGPVRPDVKGVIQRVDVDALLSPEIRAALFFESDT
jgi:chemotaxis-related protein WspB